MSKTQILQTLNVIMSRLDNIETRLDSIETRLDRVETRLDRIETSFGERISRLESRQKDVNRELNTILAKLTGPKNNSTASSSDSLFLEKQINRTVINYYENNYITAKIYDVKQEHIDAFNNLFSLKTENLYFYDPRNDIPGDHITEIDGLFEVHHFSRDYFIATKELVIIESKLEFKMPQLQSKLDILQRIKQLFTLGRKGFKDQTYAKYIENMYGDYDRISIYYGTPDWKIDLDTLFIHDNKLYHSHELPVPYQNISTLPSNTVDQLYNDNIVYKLTNRPDLNFVLLDNGHFYVKGDLRSGKDLYGGKNDDNCSDYQSS